MKLPIGLLFLFSSFAAMAAGGIQSDCKLEEMRVLRNKAVVGQIASEATLTGLDCAPIKDGKLVTIYSVSGAGGLEVYLAVFSRKTLALKATPIFKSESIAFDAFPILAKGKKRLIFVMPAPDGKKLEFYINAQTAPNENQFLKYELNMEKKALSRVPNHAWPAPGSSVPKIFSEKGKWRAILKGKIVDL